MALSRAARRFYGQMSAEVAVCRGKRRHLFPGLVPGKVSTHIRVERIEGVYQVTETCQRGCGRTITYTAGRNGLPDYSTTVYGGWQTGVQLAPKDSGVTREDDYHHMTGIQKQAVVENYRAQQLQDAGRAERIAEAARQAGPPAARFREADRAKVG